MLCADSSDFLRGTQQTEEPPLRAQGAKTAAVFESCSLLRGIRMLKLLCQDLVLPGQVHFRSCCRRSSYWGSWRPSYIHRVHTAFHAGMQCTYIRTYIHACIHTYIHTLHIRIHTYIRTYKRTCMLRNVYVYLCGWMDGWMDGRMDGWADGWMDGWMDGRMDGWMDGWAND